MERDTNRHSATTRQFKAPQPVSVHAPAVVPRTTGRVPVTTAKSARANQKEPGRDRTRWFLTVIVGIVAVTLLLNPGMGFGARLLQNAHGLFFDAQSRSEPVDQLASSILAGMTLDEKLGQLIIPMAPDTSMNADMQAMIKDDHIGGFFVTSNGLNHDQLQAYISQMQSASRIPMIMSTDFEGDGGWNVLESALGALPSESKIAASSDPQQAAYDKGVKDAQLLKSVGVNVNFAPVVDVLDNPANTVLRRRTFGSDPQVVIQLATSYIDGLTSGGIAGCLKHFPGLGSTALDPHVALPRLDTTLDAMKQKELLPYSALLATNHVPMIMTTHILIPALDPDVPTSVSPKVINGLLRHDMGYDGLVVSDALFMGGLAPRTVPEAGLEAFEAGTDLLLGAYSANDTRATIDLLEQALTSGKITQQQIDTSVLRILKFKIQWKIIPSSFKLSAAPTSANAAIADNMPILAKAQGE